MFTASARKPTMQQTQQATNYTAAWELLQDPRRSTNIKALRELLDNMGIYEEEDLRTLPPASLQEIKGQLKVAGQHRFAALLNLPN